MDLIQILPGLSLICFCFMKTTVTEVGNFLIPCFYEEFCGRLV